VRHYRLFKFDAEVGVQEYTIYDDDDAWCVFLVLKLSSHLALLPKITSYDTFPFCMAPSSPALLFKQFHTYLILNVCSFESPPAFCLSSIFVSWIMYL
jgi:hypothetical protein